LPCHLKVEQTNIRLFSLGIHPNHRPMDAIRRRAAGWLAWNGYQPQALAAAAAAAALLHH